MSTPSFVPPRQYPSQNSGRPRQGCLVWGLFTCLVVFIILAVVVAFGIYKVAHTPQGRKLVKGVGAMMRSEPQMSACSQKMRNVRAAIIRYHERNGVFPPSLSALVPTYLTDPKMLHCAMDADTSPTHITFAYKRPPSGAPGSTPLVSFHWKNALDIGTGTQNIDTQLIALLNGQTLSRQTQSLTVSADAAQANGAPVAMKGYTVHKNPDGSVTYTTTTTTVLPQ